MAEKNEKTTKVYDSFGHEVEVNETRAKALVERGTHTTTKPKSTPSS